METFTIIKSKDKDLLPGEIEIKNDFIEIKPSATMGKSFKSNDTPEHRKVYFQKCLISIENQIIMGSKLIFPNDKGILPTELVPKTIDIATVMLCGG